MISLSWWNAKAHNPNLIIKLIPWWNPGGSVTMYTYPGSQVELLTVTLGNGVMLERLVHRCTHTASFLLLVLSMKKYIEVFGNTNTFSIMYNEMLMLIFIYVVRFVFETYFTRSSALLHKISLTTIFSYYYYFFKHFFKPRFWAPSCMRCSPRLKTV